MKALEPQAPGNQAFIVSTPTQWESVFDIVKEEFPEAVNSGQIPSNGEVLTLGVNFNTRRSEEILEMKYRGFEDQVKDIIDHYLALW